MKFFPLFLTALFVFSAAPASAKKEPSPEERREEAVQKYRRAYFKHVKNEVSQGFPEARLTLAQMYLWGDGTKRNYKKAYRQFARCAQGENPPDLCRYWQALMQYYGQGTKAKPEAALGNMAALAEEGDARAQYRLGLLFLNQLPAKQAEGLRWLTRSADQGYPPAQYMLAKEYMTGVNVTPDARQAFELMRRAAERESNPARYELALMYLDGYGTPKNPAEAFNALLPAAREKYARAQLALADLYARGTGVKQSDFQTFTWTLRAAQRGNKEAQKRVSDYYRRGYGVKKNPAKADEWAAKAAAPAPQAPFFKEEND